MTARRSKLRWSDGQIRKALAPRALPAYTDEELEILRDLAAIGWDYTLARREGGRTPRQPGACAAIRRILVTAIFDGSFPPKDDDLDDALPARLRETLSLSRRKNPTSPETLRRVCNILRQCGFTASPATVLKDVRKIGTRKLRGE
jgi:hypothetical protein